MSAREFTERLSLQFSQLQTNWKSKAEQLERELLRTRQDLIKFQINSELSLLSSFPKDPLNACPPRPPPATVGSGVSFNPLHSTSTDLNPLCSQPSRLPLSQIQLDNIFQQHSQIVDSSSSQNSEFDWQSSGYSSSFSIQKENQKRTLSSIDLERAKYGTLVTEESKAGGEEWIDDIECEDDGSNKGDSDLQERIGTHVQFCTSGKLV